MQMKPLSGHGVTERYECSCKSGIRNGVNPVNISFGKFEEAVKPTTLDGEDFAAIIGNPGIESGVTGGKRRTRGEKHFEPE